MNNQTVVPAWAGIQEKQSPLPYVVDGIPRRVRLDLLTPPEMAIRNAIDIIEQGPADQRLTDAAVLLQEAAEKVADFLEQDK